MPPSIPECLTSEHRNALVSKLRGAIRGELPRSSMARGGTTHEGGIAMADDMDEPSQVRREGPTPNGGAYLRNSATRRGSLLWRSTSISRSVDMIRSPRLGDSGGGE